MPIDPVTGAELPYVIDPYAGPWPPPEWGVDTLAPQPGESPVPDVAMPPEAPEAAQARALADQVAGPQVTLGQPRPVAEPVVAPVDESLITMGDEEEPAAPPLTEDERAARLDEISSGADLGTTTQDVESPGLLDPFGETYGQRLERKTDEEIALDQYESDRAAQDEYEGKVREAARIKNEALADEDRIFRQSREAAARMRAENDEEAARLANEKIDPDGWRNSRSTFQTIAMYIAGIVGGLMQSRNGGVNRGLEMIDGEINRYIQAQQANIAHRRQMLGDKRAAAADMQAQAENDNRVAQVVALSMYDRTIAEADAAKQQFDPMGNRAREYERLQRELMARRAAAADAFMEENQKQAEHALRLQMDIEKHQAQMAKDQAQAAKLQGGGGGPSAAKGKKTIAEWNKLFPGANIPDDGSGGLYGLSEARALGEAGKSLTAPTEAEKEIRDLAIGDPRKQGAPLRNADGQVYIPPAGKATELQNQMGAAKRIVDIIDEIDAIRDRVGGESEWGNSPERQRLDVLQNQLITIAKSGTEGMSSDEDMKKLAGALGADSPASFRSQTAGLKAGRQATVENLNAALRVGKYTGPAVSFPNLHAKAKQTPDQRELARIKASKTGEKGQSIPTWAVLSPLGAIARVTEWAIRDEDASAPLPEGDRAQIDSWAKAARSGDAEGRSYIVNLAAADTRSPAVRRYAQGLLADIQARELTKATGKKPGDKGFLSALRKQVGYTSDEPIDDEEDD